MVYTGSTQLKPSKSLEKVANLAMKYDKNIVFPMQVTAWNTIKKAILRGAPPHLKMSDLNSIAQAWTMEDIIKVFRLAEELQDTQNFTLSAQIRNPRRGSMQQQQNKKQENSRQTFHRPWNGRFSPKPGPIINMFREWSPWNWTPGNQQVNNFRESTEEFQFSG